MRKGRIIGGAALVVLTVMLAGAFLFLSDTKNSAVYFTKVDNEQAVETEEGWDYRLKAFSLEGQPREAFFGASRRLRQGAFLKLALMPVRGVVRWEEVQYRDLPEAVRDRYPEG